MIANAENVDAKWSEEKMKESDALRTVECLRGRLIAERTASKVSKDEADQMENKLIELERKVKEEIKSRNRVEKKLRFLMKKLEDLNISYSSDQEECSSDNSILSPVSSSSSSHKPQVAESQSMTPTVSQASEISTLSTRSSFASIKGNLETELETKDPTPSCSPTSSMASKAKESEDIDDDSMALVLVDLAEESSKIDEDCSSSINYVLPGNVKDALDALKHAREKIQSSMEKKRIMIKLGQRGKQ